MSDSTNVSTKVGVSVNAEGRKSYQFPNSLANLAMGSINCDRVAISKSENPDYSGKAWELVTHTDSKGVQTELRLLEGDYKGACIKAVIPEDVMFTDVDKKTGIGYYNSEKVQIGIVGGVLKAAMK